MTLKFLEDSIEEFLNQDLPEVMGIYGVWGNGKTFFWNATIKNKRSRISAKFQKYSYISLFGINSLSELKKEIVKNTIDTNLIGDASPSITTFMENFSTNIKNKKASFINKWLYKIDLGNSIQHFNSFLNILIQFSLKNTVICLDDLERKGAQLTLNELMGLISDLKENKNCKIILIYNQDKFDGISQGAFNELQDKVLDRNMLFSLTPEQCCSMVINNQDEELNRLIKKYAINLNLKNIRVLKTINRIANTMCIAMSNDRSNDFELETLEHAIKSLCLFCYCYYIKDENIPSLQLLIDNGANIATISERLKSEANSEEKKLFLYRYEYHITTKMDLSIAEAVITGFLDKNTFIDEAKKIDVENKNHKHKEDAYALFKLLFAKFNQNQEAVINEFISKFDLYKECYGPSDIDYAICILKRTGKETQAKKILKDYIFLLKNRHHSITSDNYPFFNLIKDEEFLKELEQVNTNFRSVISFENAVEYISLNNGYSEEHINPLLNADEDKYYELLVSLSDYNTTNKYVKSLLRFSGHSTHKEIFVKTQKALNRIAEHSELDKLMVERFYTT